MAWAEIMADLKLRVDKRDAERQIRSVDTGGAGQAAGAAYGKEFTRDATGRLRDMHGKFVTDAGQAGGRAGRQYSSFFSAELGKHLRVGVTRTMEGIGPAILGMSAKVMAIGTAAAAAAAAVPAAVAGAAPLALAGVGAGATAMFGAQVAAPATELLKKQQQAQAALAGAATPAQAQAAQAQLAAINAQVTQLSPALQSIFRIISQLRQMWEKFTASFAPAFARAMGPLPAALAQILPALRQFFTGALTMAQPLITGVTGIARTVLPLLGEAFRATAPLLAPLLAGIGAFVTGLMPGLITMLRAAQPAVSALATFLGQLGAGLGAMFAQFAPVLAASGSVLTSLGGIIAGLLPVIAQLAGVFAQSLAPVLAAFGGAVQALSPFLVMLGGLIGDLAAALLTDLTWALQGLAQLLGAIAPALSGFMTALSGVFTMLENSGAFAVLGAALVGITGPLAQLVNALLAGLTPILPPLIGFITQLAAMLAGALGSALAAVLPPLTVLATAVLGTVAQLLPVILPPLTQLLGLFTGAVADVIQACAEALNALVTAVPPSLLGPIAVGLLAVWGAFKLWSAAPAIIGAVSRAWVILSSSFFASPLGLVIVALAAVGVALYMLWTRSATFRDIVIGVFNAVKGAALAVAGWFAGPFAGFFTAAWAAVRGAFTAALGWITGTFTAIRNGIAGPFTTWWAANGEAIKRIWSGIWTALTAVFAPAWAVVTAAVRAGWGVITAVFTTARNVIRAIWTSGWQQLAAAAQMAWNIITRAAAAGWGMLTGIFTVAVGVLRAAWTVFWNTLVLVLRLAWAAVQVIVKVGFAVLVGVFTIAINLLTGRWGAAWNAMRAMGMQIWGAINGFFRSALGAFSGWWGGMWNGMAGAFRMVWNGIAGFFRSWWAGLAGVTSAAVGGIARILSAAWNGIKGTATAIWGGIKSAIGSVWDGIKGVVIGPVRWIADNVWNKFAGVVNTFTNFVGLHRPIPVLHLAAGGKVPGMVPGLGDRQPALLEEGETVVDRARSRLLAPVFAAAGVPGYQFGGIIGSAWHAVTGGAKWAAHLGASAVDKLGDLAKNLAYGTLRATAGPLLGTLTGAAGRLPGGDTGWGQALVHLPKKMFDAFLAWLKPRDEMGFPGPQIVTEARKHIGSRYVWGGAVPGGWDCCIIGDMHVQTTCGPKEIRDITPGDVVYSWDNGKLRTGRVTYRSAPRFQQTYRLRTMHREITASGNHPFLTLRAGGLESRAGRKGGASRRAWTAEWVNLEDLARGDIIVTLKNLPDDAPPPADPLLADERFLWLLGLAFGDGTLSRQRANRVDLCVYGDLRDQVQGRLEDFCGKRGTPTAKHGLYLHHAGLAAGLRRYGLADTSVTRRLPRDLWALPHKLIQAFLDGYTAADGHRVKRAHDPALSYKAANRPLIGDVRNLHMILGHNVTRVRELKRNRPVIIRGKQVKNPRSLWTFEAYETGRKTTAAGRLLTGHRGIGEMFPAGSHFAPQKITLIEPLTGQDTYDITVEGTHNFVAEGLVVHNSGMITWLYNRFGLHPPRVAADQQRWVKPSGEVPGGLVFFGNPAYHVGLMAGGGQMINAANHLVGTIISGIGGFSSRGIPPGAVTPGPSGTLANNGAIEFARSQMASFGWGNDQMDALIPLWQGESGWNAYAQNRASGAAGIPQNINGWRDYAPGDIAAQVLWGLRYIAGRYHSPKAAYSAWLARSPHWYDDGGPINEPILGVGQYSRALYGFGGRGREWVVPDQQMRQQGGDSPLIGTYTTAFYGAGDTAQAMRELTFTLRRVKQGAFTR